MSDNSAGSRVYSTDGRASHMSVASRSDRTALSEINHLACCSTDDGRRPSTCARKSTAGSDPRSDSIRFRQVPEGRVEKKSKRHPKNYIVRRKRFKEMGSCSQRANIIPNSIVLGTSELMADMKTSTTCKERIQGFIRNEYIAPSGDPQNHALGPTGTATYLM